MKVLGDGALLSAMLTSAGKRQATWEPLRPQKEQR